MSVAQDLKPHNKEVYQKIQKAFDTNNNKTCIIMPTGSGKSYLILKLIEDYASKEREIIIIEPQRYIFNQLQEKMQKYNLPTENIKFLTYSSLGRLDEEKIKNYHNPKLVVIDEMHRAGAKIWGRGLKMMFNKFPKDCKYIGLSATPIRFLDNKRDMSKELFNGCVASEITLPDAILNRILPLPRYIAGLYTYDNEYNALNRKIQNCNNSDEEKEALQKELFILKQNLDKSRGIASIFKKYIHSKKGRYVAFFKDIKHLKEMKPCLKQWFSEAGLTVNFYEVHCKNPNNNEQFKAFMNDDGLAVCLSVGMLSEGIHGIDGVILLRSTTSPNLYYQQIGRVFAVDMGTVPIIFDFVANCESIMDCNLKDDLLNVIEKRDKKSRENSNDSNNCDNNGADKVNELTKEDIEKFFIFDNVVDAINTFKEIENRIVGYDYWTKKDEEILKKFYPSIGVKVRDLLSVKRSNQAIINKAYNLNLEFTGWTDEQIDILKNNYYKYGASGMKKKFFPEMSAGKIKNKVNELGLTYENPNEWSEKDKKFLIDNYGLLSVKEIAKELNRTESSIIGMASKLKLKNLYHNWNESEVEILKKFYPSEGTRVYERLPYKDRKQCKSKAQKLNITLKHEKTSQYKYVTWSKKDKKWTVHFKINDKQKHFGYYKDEEEAAQVALEKAKEYGEIDSTFTIEDIKK